MVAEWKEFLWDVPEERFALWGHCQTLFIRYAFPSLQVCSVCIILGYISCQTIITNVENTSFDFCFACICLRTLVLVSFRLLSESIMSFLLTVHHAVP